MSAESPALISEVARRLAIGWSFEVQGNALVGKGADGETLSIGCNSEDDAAALLAAAQA